MWPAKSLCVVCDTAKFSNNPIPGKNRDSIADINTGTGTFTKKSSLLKLIKNNTQTVKLMFQFMRESKLLIFKKIIMCFYSSILL